MEIARELALPGSAATAREQLAAAFAAPVIVQKGNLMLSRIVCTGHFDGQTIHLRYLESGKGQLRFYMEGHLVDGPNGLRLTMVVSNDSPRIPYYIPLLGWVILWLLLQLRTGFISVSFSSLFVGSLITLALSWFIRWLMGFYLTYGTSRIQSLMLKIVTISPDNINRQNA